MLGEETRSVPVSQRTDVLIIYYKLGLAARRTPHAALDEYIYIRDNIDNSYKF